MSLPISSKAWSSVNGRASLTDTIARLFGRLLILLWGINGGLNQRLSYAAASPGASKPNPGAFVALVRQRYPGQPDRKE